MATEKESREEIEEWIVERPGVGGALATLANYVACPWDTCVAVSFLGHDGTILEIDRFD